MKQIIAIIIILITSNAFAQQQQPTETAAEQALIQKLLQEIKTGLVCGTNLITTQAELSKALAKVKELEQPKEK